MIEERQESLVPPTNDGIPTLRNAYFLKPTLNSTNQPLLIKPSSVTIPQSSDPKITKMMTKRVFYHGRLKPLESWDKWVESLQKTHQETWKKAGIFGAVKASTYNVMRHNEMIINLAEKWCSETNTFIFSWGESTITLEDVMILGGFSVSGDSVQCALQRRGNEDVVKKLVGFWREVQKMHCSFHVTQSHWMEFFKGKGGEIEHIALIVVWLSRYVLTTNSYSIVTRNVFPVAVDLARGTRIAFAPFVLASIYRDLSLLKNRITTLCEGYEHDDGSKLVLWAPFQLVQVWGWERFLAFVPKPGCLLGGEPRLARWHNITTLGIRNLNMELESAGDGFLWRPYAMKLKNWDLPKFYCDQEMWVFINSELDEELLSFARCLRPSELVGPDCVEQYLPHRVCMQFGMDQDVPIMIPRLDADAGLAWSCYQKSLDGVQLLYIPPRLREGDVTVEYSNWRAGVTELSLCDKARISCKRRKRTPKKMKKLSEVSCDSKEGSAGNIPIWLSPLCDELVSLTIAGKSRGNPVGETPPCKSISTRHIANGEVKEKEVIDGNLNLSEDSRNSGGTSTYCEASSKSKGEKPLEVSEMSTLCCLPAGHGRGKAVDQDTDMTKLSVMLHGQKQGNQKNAPLCSSLNVDGRAMCLDYPARASRKRPNEITLTCKKILPGRHLDLASEIGMGKAIDVPEQTPATEDIPINLIARSVKMGEGSRDADASHSENKTPDAEVTAADELGKPVREDADISQVTNLALGDPIVVSDDDSDDLLPFLAHWDQLESRMNRLEEDVFALQAILGSKAR